MSKRARERAWDSASAARIASRQQPPDEDFRQKVKKLKPETLTSPARRSDHVAPKGPAPIYDEQSQAPLPPVGAVAQQIKIDPQKLKRLKLLMSEHHKELKQGLLCFDVLKVCGALQKLHFLKLREPRG